jgi:hypothetical protein
MNHAHRAVPWAACSVAVASLACARSLDGFTDGPAPASSAVAFDASGPRSPDDARVAEASLGAPDDGTIEARAVVADAMADGAGGADVGSLADAATPTADVDPPVNAATPRPGDLLITEIMFEPSGPEPLAEWFEVYNAAPVPERLDGMTIRDGYPHEQVVAAAAPVVVPPQAYAVLVRDRTTATVTSVPPASMAYDYGGGLPADQGVVLGNGAGGDLSLWSGATLVADVPYGPWSISGVGQSIELAVLRYEGSDQAWAWCAAPNPWAAATDYGTPGAANDCP